MNDKSLKSISSKVSRQFPEVAKSKPKVQRQSGQKTKSSTSTYLITYRGKALTADGKSINRVVRVTADDDGKIIKITTSR
ncbi:MAG: hypothetical protein ABUK20_02540 [Anaerolineales bacterium]